MGFLPVVLEALLCWTFSYPHPVLLQSMSPKPTAEPEIATILPNKV